MTGAKKLLPVATKRLQEMGVMKRLGVEGEGEVVAGVEGVGVTLCR